MTAEESLSHWEHLYSTKQEDEVSWFEREPAVSLDFIKLSGATPLSAIIDIGGGTSHLVDTLLGIGFRSVAVLDLSEAALATAKARLGSAAAQVEWIVADVTRWQPQKTYDLWHDRAAFHFLTDQSDRNAYVARLMQAIKPGGYVIIATFAPDGPERCSGLPVVRYDAGSLGQTIGSSFRLVETRRQTHKTPWSSTQNFQFSLFRYVPRD